jgi:phage gp37-like protein
MSFENPEFDYVVGGIEDGMIQVLKDAIVLPVDGGYVKTISTYAGELDKDTLRAALAELVGSLPLILVCYSDGEDKALPATPPVAGEPFVVTHECSFSVICCSDDARGEKTRRRGAAGVYKMLADARRLLSGLRFTKMEGGVKVLLNSLPMTPAGVDYIARLPDLTAYAQHFDTTFSYETQDRRVVRPGVNITASVVVRGEGSLVTRDESGVVAVVDE